MSAEVQDQDKGAKRRTSSLAEGVYRIEDIVEEKVDMKLAPETQKLVWKINTSPTTCDDPDALKKMLTNPPIGKIDIETQLGLKMTARNKKGVTIKDALDVIHKQFKKKADDELDEIYFIGFEWDIADKPLAFIIHLGKNPPSTGGGGGGGGKKKKSKGEDA